jgi:hypothetical protein
VTDLSISEKDSSESALKTKLEQSAQSTSSKIKNQEGGWQLELNYN